VAVKLKGVIQAAAVTQEQVADIVKNILTSLLVKVLA
jgi:hypothetical protein